MLGQKPERGTAGQVRRAARQEPAGRRGRVARPSPCSRRSPKGGISVSDDELTGTSRQRRRRANVAPAKLREDVRETRKGFEKECK